MRATERTTMEKKSSMKSLPNAFQRAARVVGMALMFALVLAAQVAGQQATITGTVTSTGGTPLPGVTVRVQGTDSRATTDAAGKYRIAAPADAVLTKLFSMGFYEEGLAVKAITSSGLLRRNWGSGSSG